MTKRKKANADTKHDERGAGAADAVSAENAAAIAGEAGAAEDAGKGKADKSQSSAAESLHGVPSADVGTSGSPDQKAESTASEVADAAHLVGDENAEKPADQQPETGNAAAPPAGDTSAPGSALESADRGSSAAATDQHQGEQVASHQADPVGADLIGVNLEGRLPQDVIDLVVAARMVAYGEPLFEAVRHLDLAVEVFADRVPWGDEPGGEVSVAQSDDVSALIPYAPENRSDASAHDAMASRYGDWRIHAAWAAAYTVLDHMCASCRLSDAFTERCDQAGFGVSAEQNPELTNGLAEFVRDLGRDRATPAVLAQQLKVLGHWDGGDVDPTEELVLTVFLKTLNELDAFDDAETRRQAEADAVAEPPRKVPIDETNMEPTDGPFATWGGQS